MTNLTNLFLINAKPRKTGKITNKYRGIDDKVPENDGRNNATQEKINQEIGILLLNVKKSKTKIPKRKVVTSENATQKS